MRTAIVAALVIAAAAAYASDDAIIVADQTGDVIRIRDWSDVQCPAGQRVVIRIDSLDHRAVVTCE